MSRLITEAIQRMKNEIVPLYNGRQCLRLLVGFSGGEDSTLLLYLLHQCTEELKDLSLYAIHINHGIRGEEADRDEAFCRSFCRQNTIPFFVESADIPALAKETGRGIEETARAERYRLIEAVREREKIDYCATAHHADDQVETFLFRVMRGTSTDGLPGIEKRREHIIRPLLGFTKQEIHTLVSLIGLPYVNDSTNEDTRYSRNYIRRVLRPAMEHINPSVGKAILRLSDSIRRDADCLSALAESHCFSDGRASLAALHPAILYRVLRNEMTKASLSPEAIHLDRAYSMIVSDKVRDSLSVPGGSFIVDRNRVSAVPKKEKPEVFPVISLLPGNNVWDGDANICYLPYGENTAEHFGLPERIYKLSIHVSVNSAKIRSGITVRHRQPGDFLRLNGMTKPLKKLLQEKKCPLNERSALPVFTDGQNVIWVPGLPVADDFKPADNTPNDCIYYYRNEWLS